MSKTDIVLLMKLLLGESRSSNKNKTERSETTSGVNALQKIKLEEVKGNVRCQEENIRGQPI